MAVIRQEINLIDHVIVASSAAVSVSERSQLDATKYSGTVSAYLEVVATNTGSTVTFDTGTTEGNNNIKTVSITGGTSSMTLFRSTSFTPSGTVSVYSFLNYVSGTVTVKSARIVVIQNTTPITDTETQIEIGNYNLARTTESAAILTNPKYWKYTAANWDGTKTFYAEAVYDSGDMDTISVYLYESASITAPSWSSVATIVSAATTTTPTRTRVAFTPVDGRWYTIYSLNGSMDNHDIYRAGIVVDQATNFYIDGSDATATDPNSVWTNDANAFDGNTATTATCSTNGSTSSNYLMAEGTNAGGSITVTSVRARLLGTSGTYTAKATIYTDALAEALGVVSLTASDANVGAWVSLSTPSGGWSLAKLQALETKIYRESGMSAALISKVELEVTPSLTKLEPQYLLANTALAAGTGFQSFLTTLDPTTTEWDYGSGSITYQAAVDAADNSTSVVTIQKSDGSATYATVTSPDNQGISTFSSVPGASVTADVKATTNNGDVNSVRILVQYVFSASAAAGPFVPNETYFIITSSWLFMIGFMSEIFRFVKKFYY